MLAPARAAAFRGLSGRVSRVAPAAASSFSTLSIDNLPQNVINCEYAVRGAVVIKAEELGKKLAAGKEKLPFEDIIPCNIGNPQAVGQAPLKFHRQVLACLTEPSLADEEGLFPEDVRERAKKYLEGIKDGRLGAYSHSKGHPVFRQEVANFLTERDGVETDTEDIMLTDGASPAVKMVLQMAIRDGNDGVMLPIPQYPLYSATLALLGGQTVPYYLDEEKGWGVSMEELKRSVSEFRASGGNPRGIVCINPGNPTGQVLSRDDMEMVLKFADEEGLMVCADEVYQDNVYADGKEFISFRKLAIELGVKVEVFSFHSISKGVMGECGLRGGFVHCHNVDPQVIEQMYKLASICLCSNTLGQAMMASVLSPPPLGGPSRAAYDAEKKAIFDSLKRKSKMVTERLNAIDGISCQPVEGAMYAFPKVVIKGYVMKKAISLATPADGVYCMEMVDKTGVVCVPGSGFHQKPGTFHFRMTILPTEEALGGKGGVLDRIEKFHKEHPDGWFA